MMTRPGSRSLAMLTVLVLGLARPADASHIEYVFRGKVASLLESTMSEDRAPDVIEAAGATFRAGDPFEAVLRVPMMAPTDVDHWSYWNPPGRERVLGSYTVPDAGSSFTVTAGGRTFGGPIGSQPMMLSVEDDTIGDAFSGYQRFDGDGPGQPDAWLEVQLQGSSAAILDGVALPTDLDAADFAAEGDRRSMVLRLSGLDGDLIQSVIGEIDAIEVTTIDDDPPLVAGQVGEPVPVPEPGILSLSLGLGLAALAWRRRRRRSAGG